MKKIAINGFGRIGRLFFRQALSHPELEIVAINDLGDPHNLAYLLKYDSVYRTLEEEISIEGDVLRVGRREVKVFQEKDPAKLPWKDLDIDVVIESTGAFTTFESAFVHVESAGAKRVVITAPAKDEEGVKGGRTVLMGINADQLSTCQISSNGSCTTNAAGPVVAILSANPGIEKAVLTTVHGYTASQALVDGPVKKDFRRGRAAAQNIIPSTTGAAVSVTRALPELEHKFDGIAMRVPVIAGSLIDITFVASRKTSVEEINGILSEAAQSDLWKDLIKVVNEPIVSSDVIREPYGSIIDTSYTKVIDSDLVKVLSW
ncbi:MAG: type I glyceraldehyde-3-phosphate dehydrogenase, partial [Candidatus Harrisonbacteria bacterium]|nr:type I glyceraldehyde-3-phosphate dehydrogenase [Candidatus Harrisonbacteria bacterium]